MKHFLSRSLSLLLVFALCLTIFPVTGLASEANTAEEKAQALYELGLFYGKGSNSDGTPNFALQDSATRNEAATMLIRLMGQESKAKSQLVAGTISNPFTDVPDWAKSNVAWLYENNYVNGTSAKIYSGSQAVTAQQFAALLLRWATLKKPVISPTQMHCPMQPPAGCWPLHMRLPMLPASGVQKWLICAIMPFL